MKANRRAPRLRAVCRPVRLLFAVCLAPALSYAEDPAPSSAVPTFEIGTPAEHIAAIRSAYPGPNTRFDADPLDRWPGDLGRPATITWSLAADGAAYDDGNLVFNNALFATLDDRFDDNRALWISLVEQSFDRWAALTGLSFQRVTAAGDADDGAAFGAAGDGSNRGDIRIFMGPIDNAGKTLALTAPPSAGGDILLDQAELWAFADGNYLYLRNILMQQIGYAIGLNTVCPVEQTRLMEPFAPLTFDGPQHDDIRGGQFLYGDATEPNELSTSALEAGPVEIGQDVLLGSVPPPAVSNSSLLSLVGEDDRDLIRFTLQGRRTITIIATPRGRVYDDSATGCGGPNDCCSGNVIDSSTVGTLRIELLGPDAATLLDFADAPAPGQPATLLFELETAGDFYARIHGTVDPGESLLYRVTLRATSGDCNNNGIDDAQDIASGFSTDCNGNLIPDECDIDEGTSVDCNANQVPDECDIDPTDPDGDGFVSTDCNDNQIPDDCDIDPSDPDGDGRVSPDCNGNGLPDRCDVISGFSDDCDGDEVPDECLVPRFEIQSPDFSPFGFDQPVTFTANDIPPAGASVTIAVEAQGDLGALTEWVDLELNGAPLARLFQTGAADCSPTFLLETVSLDPTVFNDLTLGGVAEFRLLPSSAVDTNFCFDARIRMSVTYDGIAANDCNANGSPDICDILAGLSDDNDGDGIPDECQCSGDLNGDLRTDFDDFAILVNCWQSACGDLTGDAVTDFDDFTILINDWGCGSP